MRWAIIAAVTTVVTMLLDAMFNDGDGEGGDDGAAGRRA
jgi:hypothetical protein